MEPLLAGRLGGSLVRDVKVVRTPLGVCKRGLEVLPTEDSLVRIWRLPPLDPARLEDLKRETGLPLVLENLAPPPALGSAEDLAKALSLGPVTRQALEAYGKSRSGWKAAQTRELRLPDPYFWTLAASLHREIHTPFRLRVRWLLDVPSAGEYAFGANVSHDLWLRLDGREVLWASVASQSDLIRAQTGLYGVPVTLTPGRHLLEADQLVLNFTDVLMHEFRLLWKPPSGSWEAIPLSRLAPAP
jgi:hypothetical protein